MRWNVSTILLISSVCAVGCKSADHDCCDTDAAAAASAESAPAVLRTADARTGRLARVLSAIDNVIAVCEDNMAHADTTAFRATTSTIAADGTARFVRDSTQGEMNATRRDLDVSIQGPGFFRIRVTDRAGSGFAYTRSGNFFVNSAGELVLGLGDGYHLDPPVALPSNGTEITISESGVIEFKTAGSPSQKPAGQIVLWRFQDEGSLSSLGDALYAESEPSGAAIESTPGLNGAGVLIQGFLEASNVNLARERLRLRFLDDWRKTIAR